MIVFWREAVIAALLMALYFTGTAYVDERDTRILHDAEHVRQVVANEVIRKEITDRSERTLSEINKSHKTVVEQAEKDAIANYIKRFGRSTNAGCVLPINGGMPGRATLLTDIPAFADSPGDTDATESGGVALDAGRDARFIQDCAIDAATIGEAQRFFRMNHFPIENE